MCQCSIQNYILGILQRGHIIHVITVGAQVPLGLEIQRLIQGHGALARLPRGWTAHKECVCSLGTKGYLCMSHTHWICLKCKKDVSRNEDKVSFEFWTITVQQTDQSWAGRGSFIKLLCVFEGETEAVLSHLLSAVCGVHLQRALTMPIIQHSLEVRVLTSLGMEPEYGRVFFVIRIHLAILNKDCK